MTTLSQVVNLGENQPCLSFHDSLTKMHIDCIPGAYGVVGGCTNCQVKWKIYQRESWIEALNDAQSEIERDLGKPICPMEICDETHWLPSDGEITLNQAPVAYLGLAEYGSWTEEALATDDDTRYFEICATDIAPLTPDDLQFSYPDAILECYRGGQYLQEPCITATNDCNGTGQPGWRFSWDDFQLLSPLEDTGNPDDTADAGKFIGAVKWRTIAINADLAVEAVGECNCSCCASQSYSVELVDNVEGVICITPTSNCGCSSRQRVRINYATGYDCFGGRDSSLLKAVSLRALSLVGQTPAKPCGCDNSFVDAMLDLDKTATTEFAHKLRYGPTVAGMEAMRIVDKYLKRPSFNRPIQSGGVLLGRKVRSLPF